MESFKSCVVYQIYPKSYKDYNGDGFGDLKGVIEKLDYIKKLGIDMIWLTPFFISPQNDNGYDISDYYNIDSRFGTMEDFEVLIKESEKRNIGIMLDMVFNHTSTEHEWFKKALKGDKKYQDYYIFKDGKSNNQPPTNWISKFGGSAWEYSQEVGKYYLHLFDKTQADLNWENEEVRKEIIKILKFWIDKGVKGFRFDVVNLISKPEIFEDDIDGDGRKYYTDGPKIHQFIQEMNKKSFGNKDIITVGEMSSTTMENCFKYSGKDTNEFSMVFNFHHLKVDFDGNNKWVKKDFDFKELKNILSKWQTGMQENNAWNAVFWCNHDQTRIVSRFGDDKKYYKQSAKMLATTIHCLRGTPYIYQGEEIGMTNAGFTSIDEYRDVESINYFEILKNQGLNEEEALEILQLRSRDNSRTPMQWNDKENAGFTEGTPWINVAKNYKTINVESNINDKDSIFYHYQKLIKLRKQLDVIADGKFEAIELEHEKVFAYKRILNEQELMVINNFYPENTEILIKDICGFKPILSNYDFVELSEKMKLRPYESIIYGRNINI